MTDLQEAIALEEQGEAACRRNAYLEALVHYEQALVLRERIQGDQSPDLAPTMTALGEIQQTLARYSEAERLYRRAFAICEAAYGPTDWRAAKALSDVAGILDEQGHYDQAQPLYEQSAHLIEQDAGPDHPETALALAKLARFYRVVGDAHAESCYQRALAIYEQLPASEANRRSLAICLNNMAFLANKQGQYQHAESLLRRALQINEEFSGSDVKIGANLKNLSVAYAGQSQRILGGICYQRAVSIYEQVLGHKHPDTVALLANIPV